MGFFRLYLAVCVIVNHSQDTFFGVKFQSGYEAVEIFFIISGFYMELILTEKYKSTIDFYINRILRIYIPYFIVLIFVVSVCLLTYKFLNVGVELNSYFNKDEFNKYSSLEIFFVVFSNIFIIFQDVITFLDDLNILTLEKFLVISPAWSIAIELTFYALVPLFHRFRNNTLWVILVISLLSRFVFQLYFDSFSSRLIIFELMFFLSGMLLYRYYKVYYVQLENLMSRVISQKMDLKYFLTIVTLIAFLLFVNEYVVNSLINLYSDKVLFENYILISYLFYLPLIPLLFYLSKRNKFDRVVGELSYPIYLTHFIIIQLLQGFLKYYDIGLKEYIAEFSVFISICFSYLIYVLIIIPVEKFRQARIISI